MPPAPESPQEVSDPQRRPPSPCNKVCVLDERGFCIGCRRTAAEIGRWTAMSAAEQWQLVSELRTRGADKVFP